MRKRIIAALLAFAATSVARADSIVLRNGDRISGEIVSKAGTELKIKTVYAGELTVSWSEVASITTDRPIAILYEGGRAPLLRKLENETDVRRIAYLNPQPHESGLGTTYAGRATLSAAYASGNTTSRRLYADAQLRARALRYRNELGTKLERRTEPALEDNLAWLATGQHDRFLNGARFLYGRGSLEHDRAKDLERRSTVGFGYGADLIDSERAHLSLRGGVEYVTERRFLGPDESYPAFGWGTRATYRLAVPRAELFHEHEGFRNLRASGVLVRSKTGVRLPFTAALSARGQLNIDWDNRPAPGRASTDSTVLLGVDYAW